jgi:hypothetical protein
MDSNLIKHNILRLLMDNPLHKLLMDNLLIINLNIIVKFLMVNLLLHNNCIDQQLMDNNHPMHHFLVKSLH